MTVKSLLVTLGTHKIYSRTWDLAMNLNSYVGLGHACFRFRRLRFYDKIAVIKIFDVTTQSC